MPQSPPELVEAVVKRREEYRHWGKDKIAVLLKEQDPRVSTSLAGRTIRRLKDRGVLKEPVRNRLSSNKKHIAVTML